MISLKKDGVIMAVSDSMASTFMRAGYTEVVEKSTTSIVVEEELADHDKPIIAEDEQKEELTYTRTIINRMSATELKELAPQYDIEVTEETSGAFLKKELIAKLGL